MVMGTRTKTIDDETQEYYTIKCKCDNCGYEGEVQLKKGEEVPKEIMCPNCECYTAHKYIPIKVNDYKKLEDCIYPIWYGVVVPENDPSIQKVYI